MARGKLVAENRASYTEASPFFPSTINKRFLSYKVMRLRHDGCKSGMECTAERERMRGIAGSPSPIMWNDASHRDNVSRRRGLEVLWVRSSIEVEGGSGSEGP
jgi:hypothetical protein